MKQITAKELTTCAVLTALALALSYAERWIPLTSLTLPGIKIGLANTVTLLALQTLGRKEAAAILLVRCIFGSIFAGNVSSLLYSISGGVLALAAMALLLQSNAFSIYGISIAGAAAHNCGQIAAACAVVRSGAPISYLPPLLLLAILTGSINAYLTDTIQQRVFRRKADA